MKRTLVETHPNLIAEWHPTKNGALTPDHVTASSEIKVWWMLSYDDPETGKHFDFEWEAKVIDRAIRGCGCPYISGKTKFTGFNDLATLRPDLAAEWHPTKNGDLTPDMVKTGSNKKVWWCLPYDDPETGKHFDFEWEAAVFRRVAGAGCPHLANKAVWPGFNDLATTHPDLAAEWHPTKNGDLTPEKTVAGSVKKVWWLLPYDDPKTGKHFDFEWEATIKSRVEGCSCPFLSSKQIFSEFNDLATLRPDLAAEWHPTKNGDLTPDKVAPNSNKKVWWLTNAHNPYTGETVSFEWEAAINNRAAGTNCPYLTGHAVWPGFNDLATLRPDIAAEWHPTKNESLSASDISSGSQKRAWWKCKDGHEWCATVASRSSGKGCPVCARDKYDK